MLQQNEHTNKLAEILHLSENLRREVLLERVTITTKSNRVHTQNLCITLQFCNNGKN